MGGERALSSPDKEPALRILVVEDNVFIAFDLEAQIQDMGHVVVGIAMTASSAIEMSNQHRPDLAIVDLQLADGSRGQDAAEHLRTELEIPSIIVSGSLHHVTADERAIIQPIAMLSKPLLPNELRQVIDKMASSQRA
ncbi:CheY chemotaxis protein or a CheY-like REC (receiver) domain [Sulfitobacter brevis]|uniref:CheY chemotaxis protein or a CheY-like REC (Receiver) domain n=1 Tax=Sulfitobacter brevis TaxID=74348 RepID=A0A1I1Z7S5_9RHOB|nr:response regulator [Sulfitobacter brevis]SFE27348.1 CheY chemotaxis protein or a CheY-like REC (receiver) domain [Sulfitobacter brevis]